MSIKLTVVSAFLEYQRGDQITNADDVSQILRSDHAQDVVASDVPDPATKKIPATD